MISSERKRTLILSSIFLLIIIILFVFSFIKLSPEFYSAFAGAIAATIFSGLLTYILWTRQQKLSKDTKAQIIQTILSEIQLNMNNVADFIKGCKDGTHFMPYTAALVHKNNLWYRFIIDYPQPAFNLIQDIDQIYGTLLLMEYYARELQLSLPDGLRFIPPTGIPLAEGIKVQIKSASEKHFEKWRVNIRALISYFDKIKEKVGAEYKGYQFKNQQYYENNDTFPRLKSFAVEI